MWGTSTTIQGVVCGWAVNHRGLPAGSSPMRHSESHPARGSSRRGPASGGAGRTLSGYPALSPPRVDRLTVCPIRLREVWGRHPLIHEPTTPCRKKQKGSCRQYVQQAIAQLETYHSAIMDDVGRVYYYSGCLIPDELRSMITSIHVHPQVEDIPNGAFAGCSNLTNVQFANGGALKVLETTHSKAAQL
ncbi:hypothetical protein THAOC_33318 [Thalassiosira oceanica]|uniref:Uncharacterized protein n=1 Tax=Thalassiosira oceanica TaxID=159749 RepID=K0RMH0_THAOC|nr:hypothetical protein THAOC_33318 [Thalassiosira oceanica]|eukprot:EJK47927.1 hypothetical protein THAOC_33318 [Thalassiosira oceanica]